MLSVAKENFASINKTEKKNKQNQQNTMDRNYLVAAADGRKCDRESDVRRYAFMLSRRITHEDVLSIVTCLHTYMQH